MIQEIKAMKSRTAHLINRIFISFLFTGITAVACLGQEPGRDRLTGTWDTAVTVIVCSSGNPITTFQSVGTFGVDGTFSGITSGTPPNLRSPERGLWIHEKGNAYRFRFKAFLFNADGNAVGFQVVTHHLELSDDSQTWSSVGVLQIFNMNGDQIGRGCSSAVGTRMMLD